MSDEALRQRLKQFPHVGRERADQIIDIVREHDEQDDGRDDVDVEALREQLDDALDHLDADQPGHASKFVRRAREQLED